MSSQIQAQENCRKIVNERGSDVEFQINFPDDIDKGRYDEIIKRTGEIITVKAFPITHSPSAKQREKAGIKEECDVLLYTAILDWSDLGIDYDLIEVANLRIKIDTEIFEAKFKNRASQFGGSGPAQYLYITFGGVRG